MSAVQDTPAGRVRQASPALRRTPQQARGRDKLDRLLAAADRIVAEEGAEAITTTRIAAEAGVSVGSVYRYLPHREAVIEVLAQHYLGLLEERMASVVAAVAGDPDGDVVGAAVDAFTAFYRTNPGFRALWFGRHLTEETRALDRAHNLRMAHSVRTMLVAVGVGGEDAATLRSGRLIQFSAEAVIHEAFRGDPTGDTALLAELKTMIRGYVDALRSR